MLRRLSRYAAGLGVAMALASPATAQYPQQQQRTDDLGIMSAPSSGTAAPGSAPIQGAQPLSIPQTQSPTITNNPDYPRQPIFAPSPYFTPFPGQVPGQFPQQLPQTRTPQQPTATPQTPATEQRGRGAFTAPGVTRDLTTAVERNEFQDFIWASTGQALPLFGHNLFEAPTTFAPVENIPVTAGLRHRPGRRASDPRLGPDRRRLPRHRRPQRHDQHPARRLGTVAGVRYQDLTGSDPQRDRAQLPQLRSFGDDRSAARGADLRRRPRAAPRQLHGELAHHPGERDLLRRRTIFRGLDARHPAQARQHRGHRVRPLRPAPRRRQVPGRAAAPRRRHLLPAGRPARRCRRQRQQPGDLRAEGPDQPRQAARPCRRPHHHRADAPSDDRAHRRPQDALRRPVRPRLRRPTPNHQGRRPRLGARHLATLRERRHASRQRRNAASLPVPSGHAHPRPDPGQGSADHARLLPAQEPLRTRRHRHARSASAATCAGSPTRSTGTTRSSSA